MEETVGILRAEDQARPDRFPEVLLQFFDRTPIDHPQRVELGAVAHTGKLLECVLGLQREAVQLPNQQLDDVVGVAFGVNAVQVPDPAAFTIVESQQALLCQRGNELDREERVARRLLVNQFR